jgi:DNA-binding NarL/FixJ family response regulator
MKVLLVEDNPAIREQIKLVLRAIPGTELVLETGTQERASNWIVEHPDGWDLVVVDLFLKQGHGFEVLRRCRNRRAHQRAVVLSNYTRDPVRQHARQAGADAVFDKSFEMDALVDYVAKLRASRA